MQRYLPIELHRPIFEKVTDTSTLLSISLVSHNVYTEAQRILYHSLDLNKIPKGRQLLLFRQLLTHGRFAHLVRRFRLFLGHGAVHQPNNEDPYWPSLIDVLVALVNLKSLALGWIVRAESTQIVERILRNCTFQLRLLDWRCPCDDVDMRAFLRGQLLLHRATITGVQWNSIDSSPLPSSAVPNLSVLLGDSGSISTLLAGRKVEELHWIKDYLDPIRPDITRISSSLRHLRVLVLGGFYDRLNLSVVVEYLDNLVYLSLIEFYEDTLEREIPLIAKLPRLQGLVLAHVFNPWSRFSQEDYHAFVRAAFSSSATIQYVDIDHRNDTNMDTYQLRRWTREAMEHSNSRTSIGLAAPPYSPGHPNYILSSDTLVRF